MIVFWICFCARAVQGKGEAPKVGWLIHSLTGAHLLHSRLLLQAAARRLIQRD